MFLDLANLSAITIALPTIQEDFNVDVGNLQWVISAYALTFGGFLLLGGRGGDIFGVGLILGGVLTAFLGWRWIFWISLILSGLVIPAAYLILPRVPSNRAAAPPPSDGERVTTRPPTEKKLMQSVRERLIRFDAFGISLGVPGVLLLTYALTSANSVGWNAPQIIATLIVSLVLLVFFIFHERSAPQAILAPHLFRNLSFNLTLVLAVNTYAVRQACTYFLTVQLQSFGNSAIHTSVLFIPLGISAFIFNTLSGRLVPILGARAMFVIGWGLSIPGVLLFAFIDEHTSYWRFTFPGMILYIAGIGAVYIAANFVIVSSASKSDQGAAAGVFNVALQVGGSVLGLAVLTAVAEGIEKTYGDSSLPAGTLSDVGYQSVYFSCAILCFIGFLLSVFAITVPESMRGTIWRKKAVVEARGMPVDNASDTYELQHTNVREN
ncbi:hypothetical protein SLS56_006354 [Neofusicoccum ribis]|uniref:Major facilitator superfamily (MFS) profile domain-containing protein n=1 Tax=Neofusicoccum ribis TaxID=45134 RepID=A0ABR3SRU1_9PEZI